MSRKSKMKAVSLSRRDFLKGSAAMATGTVLGIPYVVTSSVLAADAPSNKITIGCIGVGRMGLIDMREMMRFDQAQVVAVCDVDAKRVKYAKDVVEKHYSAKSRSGKYKGCAAYTDFRDLIAQKDIDAVSIVTPDHWHAIPAIAAAKSGKDIYLEKPLTLTIKEGRLLSDTVRRYGRILQVGSQLRSDSRFRFACELVRNGRIGKLHTVKVGLPGDPATTPQPSMQIPENLDYEMWLGPAPWASYTEKRVHPQNDYSRPGWLRILDYGAGMITGWGAHNNDIAQWGMDTEYTGPVELEGQAEFPKDGL